MKFFKLLLGTCLLGLLAACGGGGGSPGGNPNRPALVTTAGDEVTLLPGAANSYGISGGVAPYRVQNSDPATAVGTISGDVLTVNGIRAGTANVAVLDNFGEATSISVKVGSSVPLDVTAPSALTLGIGSAAAQQFGIFGGVAPYVVASSNAGVVSVSVSGTSLRLTGVFPGTASVTVRDMANAVKTINVTVASPTPLYTTAQSAITVAPGAAARTFVVGGGTGPYVASSSNASVASASLSGSTLTISGNVTGTATVSVRDAVNGTVTITVTVAPSVALYTSAASDLTVAVGEIASFSIAGGVSPYTGASSNAGTVTVAVSGTSLTITGVATGSAEAVVTDSVGARVSIQVTVP